MTARSRCDAGSRMEPESCPTRPELSDEQWSLISDCLVENILTIFGSWRYHLFHEQTEQSIDRGGLAELAAGREVHAAVLVREESA